MPTNGFTPLIPAGANLTLIGTITFTVDPTTISAQSFMVPEPASGALLLLTGLLLRRRRS